MSQAVIVAIGVASDGRREVLGFEVGETESQPFWTNFLRSLKARGLGGVKLVISDAHTGLISAIETVFAGSAWQRCRVHFMRNVLSKASGPMVASIIRTIFAQPDTEHVFTQTDMDGTLLDEAGRIPDAFWPLLSHMRERGITFVPASERQYSTLLGQFSGAHRRVSYIAENGNLVVHEGCVLSTTTVDQRTVDEIIQATRAAADAAEIGLVVCGVDSAYIERTDAPFVAEVETYYAIVDDLASVSDAVLKLAVFGDYLNDLQMLEAADWCFAVANAHPIIRSRARYLAPANSDHEVIRVLERLRAASEVAY